VGVGDTGYSDAIIEPGEWYRLAISVSLGEHYDYYLDGQLLHDGGPQVFEGRFALYPAGGANQVLFFADENGEDGPLDVALVALFDRDLSAAELADLGGYGHELPVPLYMPTYLQAPTPTSLYVCWHAAPGTESTVEYGLTGALGQVVTGNHHEFDSSTIWHWAQLTGLTPGTTYFYRCLTDTATSPIRSFRTQPPDSQTDLHVRFACYGDNRTDTAMHAAVIAAMREKVVELYGEDICQNLNVVMNVGDIVTNGWSLSQYENEYFVPIGTISGEVPFMVSIGNHEAEADYFYDYMLYEDVAGSEGERYYSFRIGPVLFICLNSNTQGAGQVTWLQSQLVAAESNEEIDWVFTFLHHPGRSEIWPDGNTAWVQYQVIPLLAQYSKAEALLYGHSHNYEHGAWPTGNLRLLLVGGGGSALDRWGMYGNQQDYPEIHRAHDHYGYTIFDIDCASGSYAAESYSLGHPDLPLDNVLLDSFLRDRNAAPPTTPAALTPAGPTCEPAALTASTYQGEMPVMSSQFQLTEVQGDWTNPLLETSRDWENVYGDSGAPDYTPIDLNEGIDLASLSIPAGLLQDDHTYWWRVRYRDRNLQWSEWSPEQEFSVHEPTGVNGPEPPQNCLFQNHPNPFNPLTTISFTVDRARQVRIAVYSLDGRLVAVLADGPYCAGLHTVTWRGKDLAGRDVPAGSYLARMESEGLDEAVKLLLVR